MLLLKLQVLLWQAQLLTLSYCGSAHPYNCPIVAVYPPYTVSSIVAVLLRHCPIVAVPPHPYRVHCEWQEMLLPYTVHCGSAPPYTVLLWQCSFLTPAVHCPIVAVLLLTLPIVAVLLLTLFYCGSAPPYTVQQAVLLLKHWPIVAVLLEETLFYCGSAPPYTVLLWQCSQSLLHCSIVAVLLLTLSYCGSAPPYTGLLWQCSSLHCPIVAVLLLTLSYCGSAPLVFNH